MPRPGKAEDGAGHPALHERGEKRAYFPPVNQRANVK